MDKDILATVVRCNEPPSFCHIKPFTFSSPPASTCNKIETIVECGYMPYMQINVPEGKFSE